MRYEDLPSLPLYIVGRAELQEAVRAAVTQCELLPTADAAQRSASGQQTTALQNYFSAISARLSALSTTQAPPA